MNSKRYCLGAEFTMAAPVPPQILITRGMRSGSTRATSAVSTVDYKFSKPGATEPAPQESYVTRIGNEGCGVGYYK
jgi:hypothetical protein